MVVRVCISLVSNIQGSYFHQSVISSKISLDLKVLVLGSWKMKMCKIN